MRAILATTILLVALGVPGSTPALAQDETVQRMLFVGNSFTYVEGVDQQVVALAASGEPPTTIEADAAMSGGATLKQHAQGGVLERIRDGGFDTVVLQGDIPENREQTIEPFIESARLLHQAAADAGARTVFYMTWPFAGRPWVGLDAIASAHREIETELGTTVAPAGLAFTNALTQRPDIAMIGPDGHQTAAGAYLAANVIYATLFDRSPEGSTYRPDAVSSDDAAYLQEVAWRTVQEWQAGAVVPPPHSAVWVTATELCTELDWDTASASRTSFEDGTWHISAVPFSCLFRASDDRLSGSLRKVWDCDCRFGFGSPTMATWELTSDDGGWNGTYNGVLSPSGNDRGLLVAKGTGAYEGLTYMANLDGSTGVPTLEGAIIEGEWPADVGASTE